MLESLQIKNVALIKEISVDFSQGLNVLSGETGSGKSIIIDSVNFLMGNRVGKDFIRTGSDEAEVRGVVSVENSTLIKKLQEMGFEPDEDNTILISRTMNKSGKSRIKINGKTATQGTLKEISQYLIDFHGQHEQPLLKPSRHIELLDKFCGSEFEGIKALLRKQIDAYKELNEKIKLISGGEMERNSKLDFLRFQMEEIEEASLKPNEEEELNAERKLLENMEDLINNSGKAIELLYSGSFGSESAADKLYEASKLLLEIYENDSETKELYEQAESISAQLDDLIRELRRYASDLEHDPERLSEVTGRLELIFKLKRKYGQSVEEILAFYEKVSEEYNFLINSTKLLDEYTLEKEKLVKQIKELCRKLHSIRLKNAKIIETQIESQLKDLGMKNVQFVIAVEHIEEFNYYGSDKVEFMISPNAGEPVKQLSKIASGGEMSRVMLAMKTVLAKADNIDTFVFDEIDTGVSGRTAQKVAEKLAVLSRGKQILCITHLPQIASMSDNHYLIEKITKGGNTITNIKVLDYEGIINELARLMGGAEITENTMTTAKELREMAEKIKSGVV